MYLSRLGYFQHSTLGVLQSWLWTPTDYLFLLSNLSTFYLPVDHPVSPSLTSTTQTPIVCLRFYCSSLCIVSHPLFYTVDIPNAPFHFTIVVLIDPRSCTDTLSGRPSFVDVPVVYKETPSLGSWALSLT